MGESVGQDGWVELRVHGVSGTPPESMLAHPHVTRVAGDAQAGFYRRRWEAPERSGTVVDSRLEAYSWGGLTAGSSQRALWLLLAPFLLVNVAFWAHPATGPQPSRPVEIVRRVGEAAQRLFALTISLTLVLAVVAVSMDFIGWQCVQAGQGSCADKVSWLRFLSWEWFRPPGRRLAVTALLPLALVGLLWWLAHKTWRETEAVRVPEATPEEVQQTPLENRHMWNGTSPVRRLRAVHVTVCFATIGVFLLAPYARHLAAIGSLFGDGVQRPTRLAAELLFVAALTLAVVGAALAIRPDMTDRDKPQDEAKTLPRRDLYSALPLMALLVDAGALVVLWLPGLGSADPAPGAQRTPLPWHAAVVELMIAAQAILLVITVLVLAILLSRRRLPRRPDAAAEPVNPLAEAGATDAQGRLVNAPPAWFGLATAVFMMCGSALGGAYAAALVLAVAHTLGKPMPTDRGLDPFVVPMPYFWAAALSVPIAVLALGLAGVALVLVRRKARRRMLDEVTRAYPAAGLKAALAAERDPENAATIRRARDIARAWAFAGISETGRRLTGAFVVGAVALIGAAGILYLNNRDWVYSHLSWMVNVGDVIVGGFALLLLYVGRQAYRDPKFRRGVGVLWDLGTFWPRATHPLAPPCYAERAVPDLITRIRYLGRERGGWVVLSCHSQGTVIGAAVVMQLAYEESARVALLTYGSPLRRLYARFFPAYFGAEALSRAGAFLLGPPLRLASRAEWPWRNLYRLSDPIGGAVLRDFDGVEIGAEQWTADPEIGDNNDVDRRLVDPTFAKAAGNASYPQAYGHSGYPDDRAYEAAVNKVKQLRQAGYVPAPSSPAGAPVPRQPAH